MQLRLLHIVQNFRTEAQGGEVTCLCGQAQVVRLGFEPVPPSLLEAGMWQKWEGDENQEPCAHESRASTWP